LRRRGFSPDVYFELDDSTLSDETRDRLARNADLLKSQPQFQLTIEGHADERGTNEYNLALGERRANAVRDYLGSLGVGADRMRTLSYGEERPVCTTSEDSCWSQNRRGHMVITGRANVG
jgi:peptidoglycan-associated lipoprotein